MLQIKVTSILSILLAYSIIISGCTKEKDGFPDLIYISTIDFSSDEQPFSPIRLIQHNNMKYILENEGKRIDVYDENNRLVNAIGSAGKGPAEFISPLDMAIIDTLLVVLDFDQINLKIFHLDGSFIKTISLDFMPITIAKSDDSFLVSGIGMGEIPYAIFNFHFEKIANSKITTVNKDMQLPTSTYANHSNSFYIFSQLSYDNKIWIYEIEPKTGREINRLQIPASFVSKEPPLPSSISDVAFYRNLFFIIYTAPNNKGMYPLEIYSNDFQNKRVYFLEKSNPQMRITISNDCVFLVSPQDTMEIFLYKLLFK
jgi:hypothetical protein